MMLGFQTAVQADMRTAAEIVAEARIAITASMHPDVAYQLAQFAERSTFDTFYQFTEAHLSHEERTFRAYQMIAGMEAVAIGLHEAGYAPR